VKALPALKSLPLADYGKPDAPPVMSPKTRRSFGLLLKQLLTGTVVRPLFRSVSIVVFLAMASVANAGPFEDGQAAYQRQDYATALQVWRPLADHGDAKAQNKLGNMYAAGQGLARDDAEAMKWYCLAADQGYPNAEANLGEAYSHGRGVAQDYAEAAKWFRKAADQGFAPVQFTLGVMYGKGQGVPQDYEETVKWYHLAADHNLAFAQTNLGIMYAVGHGVEKDYVRAYMWLNLAAAQGDRNASLGRDRILKDMSSLQVAEAQRLAREWKPAEPTGSAGLSPEEKEMSQTEKRIIPFN
jgi:uncharacterized protein